jgi:hypothetical protein
MTKKVSPKNCAEASGKSGDVIRGPEPKPLETAVQRRPQAEIDAEAAERGSIEKVPTAYSRSIYVDGVTIESRWAKAEELEQMAAIIRAMAPEARKRLRHVYFNSKEGGYTLHLFDQGEPIAAAFEAAAIAVAGGHNGINVDSFSPHLRDSETKYRLEALWPPRKRVGER